MGSLRVRKCSSNKKKFGRTIYLIYPTKYYLAKRLILCRLYRISLANIKAMEVNGKSAVRENQMCVYACIHLCYLWT